jgi:hypothetical protein
MISASLRVLLAHQLYIPTATNHDGCFTIPMAPLSCRMTAMNWRIQRPWNRGARVQWSTGYGDCLRWICLILHCLKRIKRSLPSKLICSRAAPNFAESSAAAREAPVELSTGVKPDAGNVAALFSPDWVESRTYRFLIALKMCFIVERV